MILFFVGILCILFGLWLTLFWPAAGPQGQPLTAQLVGPAFILLGVTSFTIAIVRRRLANRISWDTTKDCPRIEVRNGLSAFAPACLAVFPAGLSVWPFYAVMVEDFKGEPILGVLAVRLALFVLMLFGLLCTACFLSETVDGFTRKLEIDSKIRVTRLFKSYEFDWHEVNYAAFSVRVVGLDIFIAREQRLELLFSTNPMNTKSWATVTEIEAEAIRELLESRGVVVVEGSYEPLTSGELEAALARDVSKHRFPQPIAGMDAIIEASDETRHIATDSRALAILTLWAIAPNDWDRDPDSSETPLDCWLSRLPRRIECLILHLLACDYDSIFREKCAKRLTRIAPSLAAKGNSQPVAGSKLSAEETNFALNPEMDRWLDLASQAVRGQPSEQLLAIDQLAQCPDLTFKFCIFAACTNVASDLVRAKALKALSAIDRGFARAVQRSMSEDPSGPARRAVLSI